VTDPTGDLGVGGVRGIGVDAVDVVRFRQVIERRPGIVDRLFTDTERAYAQRSRDPGPRLAVRFAAKEAVLKALGVGVGAAGFRDVEVVRGDNGEPGLALSGRAAALSVGRGVRRWHVSLTHTDTVAVATVVAEGTVVVDGTVHGGAGVAP
jgi:holo-[acyl-carrier protein] synthase